MIPVERGRQTVRVAAAGDIHCNAGNRDQVAAAFEEIRGEADVVLLAGDLTTYGEPDEAAILADIVQAYELPIYAVLGNHDWHANRSEEISAILDDAGIEVLNRSSATTEVGRLTLGIAGVKGFIGGFPDSELPDFGEPLLRRVYAETTAEVDALSAGLASIAGCDLRIVLLHYAPTTTTLEGERQTIWAFLGSDRLAEPIARHRPDLVVHGHGHAGSFDGFIGSVPVYNVAVPVLGRDFFVFELDENGLVRAEAERPVETPRTET